MEGAGPADPPRNAHRGNRGLRADRGRSDAPREWLRSGPLRDYTIPALALGILCGGPAIVAALLVALRPHLEGLAAIVSGVTMVVFEIVEIASVGFAPAEMPEQPQNWLQVFYVAVGVAVAARGMRLHLLMRKVVAHHRARQHRQRLHTA